MAVNRRTMNGVARHGRRLAVLVLAWMLMTSALIAGEEAPVSLIPKDLKTRHVVILVIDGARWTETWGRAGRDLIPVRATVLAPQGVMFTDMANDGPTYTDAGHAALVTGFYQEINNSGLELPRNPTISQRLLATGVDSKQAWIVTSKDKLQILTDSSSPEWKHKFVCAFDCGVGGAGVGSGYRDDATTVKRVKEVISRDHPRFLLINFKEPDASGHGKNWESYLQGIRDTDQYVGQIWDSIQADVEMKDRTALFVTNDHGRHLDGHKDGFVSHGDDCAGCRKIELLAVGPDFRHGATVDAHHNQLDVAVTTAALLGLTIPGSTGRVIEELFTAPAVPVAPVAPVAPAVPAPITPVPAPITPIPVPITPLPTPVTPLPAPVAPAAQDAK